MATNIDIACLRKHAPIFCKPNRISPDERGQAQHVILDRSQMISSSNADTMPTKFVLHASVSLQCTSIALRVWSDRINWYHPPI